MMNKKYLFPIFAAVLNLKAGGNEDKKEDNKDGIEINPVSGFNAQAAFNLNFLYPISEGISAGVLFNIGYSMMHSVLGKIGLTTVMDLEMGPANGVFVSAYGIVGLKNKDSEALGKINEKLKDGFFKGFGAMLGVSLFEVVRVGLSFEYMTSSPLLEKGGVISLVIMPYYRVHEFVEVGFIIAPGYALTSKIKDEAKTALTLTGVITEKDGKITVTKEGKEALTSDQILLLKIYGYDTKDLKANELLDKIKADKLKEVVEQIAKGQINDVNDLLNYLKEGSKSIDENKDSESFTKIQAAVKKSDEKGSDGANG